MLIRCTDRNATCKRSKLDISQAGGAAFSCKAQFSCSWHSTGFSTMQTM